MASFTNYFDILNHHADTKTSKNAICCESEHVTYAKLNENIGRFGNLLREVGVKPKDRVVIAIPDSPDSYYAFFGAMKWGAWPTLISPDLSRQDYEYILQDSQASALITVRGSEAAEAQTPSPLVRLFVDDEVYPSLLAGAAADLNPYRVTPENIAFLQYTSGSTGNPKGVPHSQADMIFSPRHYAGEVLNMSEKDVVFSASKLFFGYGFGNAVTFPVFYGASAVLLSGKPGPADVLGIVDQYGPTLFFGVPTLYNMMLKFITGPVSMPSLRFCVSAGEALPASYYHLWKEVTGLEIIDGIGSTEALHIFISNRPGDVHPGSSGLIVPGYEAKVVGDDGLPVKTGQQGILCIRGGSTAPCYWNKPKESAKTMLPEGWLRTGDYFVEDEGCYTCLGRQDDLFKVGGAWVSPPRVEEAVRSHPAIMECAVTSREYEGLLKPMAYVVLNAGFTGDMKLTRELRGHVLQRLPDYMCPVQFNYVQELPKTRTGKVQRYILKGENGA
ncbi:MAG TPA: benzoate-CoA ligase family protein [Syntrophobacteraceae bacterium]|nr:benzoate-CoA ligase family protein [Syntrophobacteraceae bacterium]